MKVRKKPVILDAYLIEDTHFMLDSPDWVVEACHNDTIFGYVSEVNKGVRVKTLEGDMFVPFGHYLIQGVEGEIYGCEPNIFKKTYEILERESE